MSGGMPTFDWDDLRVFHTVVSAGSLTAAADRLGVRQPTVSRRLDALETRIGARLVTRGADGVSLTETGERIWTNVETMLGAAGDIARIAGQADQTEEGRVRLSAPDCLAALWIARHIAGFMEANPRIRLELTTQPADSANPADIALQLHETQRVSMISQPLASVHFVPLAARAYVEAYGAPDTLSRLLEHRLAFLDGGVGETGGCPRETAALRAMAVPALTSDSAAGLYEALTAGGVVAIAPSFLAARSDTLVSLDLDLHARATVWMVFHPDQRKVVRVRKVIDWLREIFDGARHPWFRKEYVAPAAFSGAAEEFVRDARPGPRASAGERSA